MGHLSTISAATLRPFPSLHRSPLPPISRSFLLPPSSPLAPLSQSRRSALTASFCASSSSPLSWKPLRFRPTVPRSSSVMAEQSFVAASGNGEVLVFDTEENLSVLLAKYTAELSEKYARERGAFTVVLSGGSLIKSLRKLVEAPYANSVEWAKWHVFWVDERVVPKDHADSNYKLAYDGFLSKVPIPPGQVYAINDALSAEGAADDYETGLKQLVKTGVVDSAVDGFPRFDLHLLGMGPDGHVASLFPGHPLVKEGKQWVAFITDSPKPPPERITFTFPVINASANIALVVTGAGKADAVCRALGNQENSSDLLPVQMVSLNDGKLTWFTDKGAVSKLKDKASL